MSKLQPCRVQISAFIRHNSRTYAKQRISITALDRGHEYRYAAAMTTLHQPFTRLDHCQYFLVSQITYTLTNFADHTNDFSHDMVNRFLDIFQILLRRTVSWVIQSKNGENSVVLFRCGISRFAPWASPEVPKQMPSTRSPKAPNRWGLQFSLLI